MSTDSLGDRMKDYEQRAFRPLVRRVPVLLRIDGKAFHTWTKGLKRPFDEDLKYCMNYAMFKVCEEVEGARLGYCQSDEISVLICDYQDVGTQAWFDYRANKIESVAASICTASFNHMAMNRLPDQYKKKGPAYFDARAWNLPREEITNYFIWRQRDCEKNSISQLAMAHFSHNELKRKNGNEKQDMLMLEKGINWNDEGVPNKRGAAAIRVKWLKNGAVRTKWIVDLNMPIISRDREYVEKWVGDAHDLDTLKETDFFYDYKSK